MLSFVNPEQTVSSDYDAVEYMHFIVLFVRDLHFPSLTYWKPHFM